MTISIQYIKTFQIFRVPELIEYQQTLISIDEVDMKSNEELSSSLKRKNINLKTSFGLISENKFIVRNLQYFTRIIHNLRYNKEKQSARTSKESNPEIVKIR